MKTSLIKDIFREIKKSKGKFLSIFFIVMIGVACFSGVKVSSPVMKHTADNYYKNNNLMDIQVVSNLGLTNEDINEIKKLKDVKGAKGAYSKEALVKIENSEKVVKVHSLNIDDAKKKNENYINRVELVEGRLPKNENECLVESSVLWKDIKVGEKITIYGDNGEDIKEDIKNEEYKIVGKVKSPYYVSRNKGGSDVGSGELNSFVLISDKNFKSDVYTESFITLKGVEKFNSYNDDYENTIKKIEKKIEKFGKERGKLRYKDVVNEATDKVNSAKKELEDKKEEVYGDLSNAKKEIDQGRKDLKNGESEISRKEREAKSQIKNGKAKLEDEENKLLQNEKKLKREYNNFINNKSSTEKQLSNSKKELEKGKQGLSELRSGINTIEEKLSVEGLPDEEKGALEQSLAENKAKERELSREVSSGEKTLRSKESEFYNAENTFEESFAKIKSGKNEIESQKNNLDEKEKDAKREFENAREELKYNKKKLTKGEKEYEEGLIEANDEFRKAENKIKENENKIKDIKEGKWYVLDRYTNYGFVDFGNSADSIDAIAKIFPVFFALVAALICLTTMTRMVDEQRVNIGTLKGLGYSKISIASKYVLYAAFASVGGAVLGLLIGFTVFPTVIYNTYTGMNYALPKVMLIMDASISIISIVFAVLITTLSAIFACYKELLETPSTLMRPKAPKLGKRILIERIPFIWNKINFIQKVTLRNIFRYKKRFLMTVIGISGCTALLLTGFGIKDSISSIINKQYGEVFKYNGVVNYKTEVLTGEKNNVLEMLSKDNRIKGYENVREKNISVKKKDDNYQSSIFVLENPKKVDSFVGLKDSNGNLKLSEKGVIITEKLSKLLEVKEGDKIILEDSEKKKFNVLITGITENYVAHYIYMTPNFYKNLFGVETKYNQVLIKTNNISKNAEESISKDFVKNDNITAVNFKSFLVENFEKMLSNLGYVTLLLVISSGALAFVVLYNLTNVNISERLREIATIKVLGFYDREVSAYVFRENMILTVIGAFAGLGLGAVLHRFIMTTVELEAIMFSQEINIISFVNAFIITISFSLIVNFFMYFKLKKIEMVESLKSVD